MNVTIVPAALRAVRGPGFSAEGERIAPSMPRDGSLLEK